MKWSTATSDRGSASPPAPTSTSTPRRTRPPPSSSSWPGQPSNPDEHGTWIDAQPTRHQIKAYRTLATHAAELEVGTTVLLHSVVETIKWNDRTTGEPRTRDRIIADAIGASLRFVTVTKTERGAA